jgi:LysR family glycine cleavage system transcriptional activator
MRPDIAMHLPHLTFLRSFEASARHMSFTNAAVELNCTQSAVSNHVRSLEDFIGRPLFVRHPRSLSLTDVGEAYLPSVRHALQEIDRATQSLITQTHKREVVVSCPFSLAANWLPEVIRGFCETHPGIDLTVHGTIWTDVEENVSDISISINHVDDVAPDLTRLWAEDLTVLCSPDYLVNGEVVTRPEQLYDAGLIYILGRLEYWKLMTRALDLAEIDLNAGPSTSATNLALEMAVQGLGCVAAPRSLAHSYLTRGLLVEPFGVKVASPWVYCLRVKEKSATPTVKLFLEWLLMAAKAQDDWMRQM